MSRYISSEELKKIQLNILKRIAEYCDQHKLRYFLGYGSLIGAIRHNGYIPWDDDIDIVMPRPDYEQLMQSFNDSEEDIKVVSPSNSKEYYLPFGKAYDERTVLHETQFKMNTFGVYIDIFPLDGAGDLFAVKKEKWLNKLVNVKKAVFKSNRSILKKIVIALGKVILFPISTHSILKKMERIAKKNNFESSEMVNCLFSPYAQRECCPRFFVETQIDWTFEGMLFKVPLEYDRYLKNIYGDYMKLPPEEKRVAHHQFVAWWK